MRRLGVPAALAALALVLSACTVEPPPRMTPNGIERTALANARNIFRTTNGAASWVQLWTVSQAGAAVEKCINLGSNGAVNAQVTFSTGGVEFGYGFGYGHGTLAGASSPDISRYTSPDTVQQLASQCFAATPVDDRVLHLTVGSWAALYSYDVTVLRRCLMAHGESVARPPGRERFENLLRAGTPWSPYDGVVVRDRAAWFALSDACPALPAALSTGL